MKQFVAFLKKDLLIELRGKELFYALLSLALLIAVFFGIGIENAFIEQKAILRLFPTTLWVAYIFAATASISRTLYYEVEAGALSSVITARASLIAFYFAKVCSTTLFTVIAAICIGIMLALFFNPVVAPLDFLLVATLVSLGYSSLAILISMMTVKTKLRDLLLPLLLFPLLFPIFFAAHELTMGLVLHNTSLIESQWLSLLVLVDIIYLLGGSILFVFTARG